MKRFLSLVIIIALLISIIPSAAFGAAAVVEGDDDALAYVTYNRVKYTPDEHGVTAVEIPYAVSYISTESITPTAAKGFAISAISFLAILVNIEGFPPSSSPFFTAPTAPFKLDIKSFAP